MCLFGGDVWKLVPGQIPKGNCVLNSNELNIDSGDFEKNLIEEIRFIGMLVY